MRVFCLLWKAWVYYYLWSFIVRFRVVLVALGLVLVFFVCCLGWDVGVGYYTSL